MMSKKYLNFSKDELIKEIIQLKKRKKFGLNWENKREEVIDKCTSNIPLLKEDSKKKILVDKNKPINLLIEGDNFHSLSCLNYTHYKKIDIIYADPPYNNGKKDWKYNNDFVDKEDPYRHSKWLSFMYKRLSIAKNLLKPDGVLICTIDKNEQENLGLLLREIFFEKTVICVSIIHNPGGIQGDNFSYTNEFAYFVYPKKGVYISKKESEDNKPRAFRDWGKPTSKRSSTKTMFYPIFVKNNKIIGFGDVCDDDFHPKKSNIILKNGVIAVYPIDNDGVERKWRFKRDSVEEIAEELICKNIKNEISIFRIKKNYRWKTVWTDKKYSANTFGTKLLNNIIKGNFPFPKSLYAVMDCIKAVLHDKNNSIILDFFAGSGTTGHAVLELNKNDNGNRKFILCTNNEDNNNDGLGVAEDICYKRISKLIKGYKGIRDKKFHKGLGGNLSYFKTIFCPSSITDKNKKLLLSEIKDMLCIKEGKFNKIKENKDFSIYGNKEGYMGIIYNHQEIENFKKEIYKIDGKFNIYIFSLGEDDFEEEFEVFSKKIKILPLPDAILRAYNKIFNR